MIDKTEKVCACVCNQAIFEKSESIFMGNKYGSKENFIYINIYNFVYTNGNLEFYF